MKKTYFLVGILSGKKQVPDREPDPKPDTYISQCYGSADPDPYRTKMSQIHNTGAFQQKKQDRERERAKSFGKKENI